MGTQMAPILENDPITISIWNLLKWFVL